MGTSLSGVTKTTQGSTRQLVLEQNSQLGLVTTEMQLQYVHGHLEVKGSTFNCVNTNKMSNPADVKQQKQAPLGK